VTVEEELASIRKTQTQREAQRAKALVEIEIRQKQLDEAMEELKSLGCDSVEQAREKIISAEDEIKRRLEEIKELIG
jgi:phosphosulfolactate synthase (CoM biosynthesis protein A)